MLDQTPRAVGFFSGSIPVGVAFDANGLGFLCVLLAVDMKLKLVLPEVVYQRGSLVLQYLMGAMARSIVGI